MFNRVLAAACAAALGAVVLTAPVETAARGGGGGGHFGGFRPFAMRPFHPVRPPFVPVRRVSPLVPGHGAFGRFGTARAAFFRHHRGFSYGGPGYGDGGSAPFYGSYYDPSDIVGTLPPPVVDPFAAPASAAGPGAQVAGQHFGCRSQTVTVPAAAGGERDVTITRC